MKALERIIKDRRALVFLDLEGTQFSHEMIEIGAYVCILNDDLSVKSVCPPYKSYVLAHHPIGSLVSKMTGINEKKLQDEGRDFTIVMSEFKHYVGKYWGRCLFVTFGSHDLRIINQSVLNAYKPDVEISRTINKNHFDFSAFLSQYIQDPNGNPLSLTNYLKVYEVPFEGQAHDALADAYNLIDLYKAFLSRNDINEREYKKSLSHLHHLPTPVSKVLKKLNEGKNILPEDWDKAVKESFL